MDNTQKQILKDITTRLDQSTYTDWNTGDLDDWSEYGKKMKSVIVTVTPIINTIANGIQEPNKRGALSLDDVEHLRWMYNRLNENPNVDFMKKFDNILKKLE